MVGRDMVQGWITLDLKTFEIYTDIIYISPPLRLSHRTLRKASYPSTVYRFLLLSFSQLSEKLRMSIFYLIGSWNSIYNIDSTALPLSCTDCRYFYYVSGTAFILGCKLLQFWGNSDIFLLHFGYTKPNQEIDFKSKLKKGGFRGAKVVKICVIG